MPLSTTGCVYVRVQCLCAVLGVLTWGNRACRTAATGAKAHSHIPACAPTRPHHAASLRMRRFAT
eukprot:475740-Prymnesium_polylepis.1